MLLCVSHLALLADNYNYMHNCEPERFSGYLVKKCECMKPYSSTAVRRLFFVNVNLYIVFFVNVNCFPHMYTLFSCPIALP